MTHFPRSTYSSSVSVTLGTVGGATWYADTDQDGYGDPANTLVQCTQPANYVSNSDDECPEEYAETLNGCPLLSDFSDENYIYTIAPQIPVQDITEIIDNKDAIKNITYFDGLGRPMQSIAIKQSAINERDIIAHIDYDEFGRQDKDYLPYVPDEGRIQA
ncbi:unnamed protein product, partial [marine sediment metagenome]